jgi:hypothetical protein
MIEAINVFPTTIMQLRIDPQACINLLEEIDSKKNTMKIISNTTQQQKIENYITDYERPLKLEWFEKIWNQAVTKEFRENGKEISLVTYWSAIYGADATHQKHTHSLGYLDSGANYSGILYLTSLGHTSFFSPNHTALESQYEHISAFSKMIFFPSTLLHEVKAHSQNDTQRYVVSFNAVVEQ